MTAEQALNYAIFAINTLQHPDASSAEDCADLDAHADEALEELVALRDRLLPLLKKKMQEVIS